MKEYQFVARNAAHICPSRNIPYPGSWRFLCNMKCRHLCPPLSRRSRRIWQLEGHLRRAINWWPVSHGVWGDQELSECLDDPKVDNWGRFGWRNGFYQIFWVRWLAIRFDSWEWVIHRWGSAPYVLEPWRVVPQSVTRKNLSVTMG